MSENPEPAKKDEFSFSKGMDFCVVWLLWFAVIVLLDERLRLFSGASGKNWFLFPLILSFFPAWLSIYVWLSHFRERPRAEATSETSARAGHAFVIVFVGGIAIAAIEGLR
jgi:hypothetical protein